MITPFTHGIMICVAAFLHQCLLGVFYIWGGISVYVSSYFRQYYPKITAQELGTFMPIRALIFIFLMPMGAYVEAKTGPRLVLLVTGVGMIFFVFLLAYTKTIIGFVINFSLAFAIPTFAFYVSMMCAWKYFPGKQGIITGFTVCGFSLGPLIFGYISQKIVNPNDVAPKEYQYGAIKEHYFEAEVYNNVPKLFIILAIVWGLMFCYIICAVQNPSKEELEVLTANNAESGARGYVVDPENDCPSVKTAFKHRTLWILLFLLTVATWTDFIFGLAYKELGFNYRYSDSYLTMVGILYSFANTVGRIFWGFISQRVRFPVMYSIILAGQTLFSLTLCNIASSTILYPLWIMGSTFFTCGNFVTFAPLSMKIYGASYGQIIYTYIATAFAFGAIVVYFVNIYVLPHIGYKLMLQSAGYISAFGYVLLWLAELSPKWKTEKEKTDYGVALEEINNTNKDNLMEQED